MNATFNGMEWVYGLWFVGDGASDFMGTLGKKNGKWFWEYRFRYYRDSKAHGSDDEKNWYAFSAPDDSARHLAKFLDVVGTLVSMLTIRYGGAPVDFVDLQCAADDPKIFFELGSRPWAHLKLQEGLENAIS